MAQAPRAILDHIEGSARNADPHRNCSHNETQSRQDFMARLFDAPGWDRRKVQSNSEKYTDLVQAEALRIGRDARALNDRSVPSANWHTDSTLAPSPRDDPSGTVGAQNQLTCENRTV